MELTTRMHRLTQLPRQTEVIVTAQDLQTAWIQNGPLQWGYGCSRWSEALLTEFDHILADMGIADDWQAMLEGHPINTSEHRAVRHHYFRSPQGRSTWMPDLLNWVERVQSGAIRTRDGRAFTHVVQVGIGGSELGPKALLEALKRLAVPPALPVYFVSNLDQDDLDWVWQSIHPVSTLFIVASKSGDTVETLVNRDTINQRLMAEGVSAAACIDQWVAITTPHTTLDDPSQARHIFYLDSTIGGRFSSASPMGCLALGLGVGTWAVTRFLDGMWEMDQRATLPLRQNMALLSAMMGVWERVVMGSEARAVVPYSQPLSDFPAHIQQLESESLGKSISNRGEALSVPTAPAILGGTGTQSQHSFFQQLHQGTQVIPLECVVVRQSQQTQSPNTRSLLLAHVASQTVALAKGSSGISGVPDCKGNRPVTLVVMDELTPDTYGALLAYMENRTIFQGLIWGINPFDQPGVQLGKSIYQSVQQGQGGLATTLFTILSETLAPSSPCC